MAALKLTRKRLSIGGQVQGVGFRPFVYRLAVELGLTGWVSNDARGVTIEVQGRAQPVKDFCRRLVLELPPLAHISRLDETDADPLAAEPYFEIHPSVGGEFVDAQVTVDIATCADCLREMNDPADPRYHYPFINCTNCGPRYTIVRRIPYDRPNTTMADFAMCSLCSTEYSDPADRRFHAQPVACPVCGPSVWLVGPDGRQVHCDNPIGTAAGKLESGQIVALKGLGGFHLACRADDDQAVRRLRERKRRDAKPFAVMVVDLAQARALCVITPEAEALLTGPIRPIVLLPRRPAAEAIPQIAPSVAEGLDTLGILLPYTPLHHLLLARARFPLVMTSANYSHEPLVKDNEDAVHQLGSLADALLLHNRLIERRLDDSVVQLSAPGRLTVLRRARGYAPQPVVPEVPAGDEADAAAPSGAAILAVGAELKSAVCLYRDGRAVLGEHIGDLKDGRTYRHFIDTIHHLEQLYDVTPEIIAADMHPQYLSTDYAMRRHRGELPARPAARIVRVQHHHAHVAACLADNGRTGEAIGLVCDGVGYGDDGAVWGCEVLRADLRHYERLGHLRYLPLPGGDQASVETYRPALAALYDTFGEQCLDHRVVRRLRVKKERLQETLQMLQMDVNCPPASSLGRWFDAVAALCGLATENRYEGEAPMVLEAAAADGVTTVYEYRLLAGGPFLIDLRPMVEQLTDGLAAGTAVPTVAARFHNTVVRFLLDSARRARDEVGLNVVALSGGCFANRYLTTRLVDALEADGFDVLTHRTVPPNDGGIALGQAVIAAARTQTPRGADQHRSKRSS